MAESDDQLREEVRALRARVEAIERRLALGPVPPPVVETPPPKPKHIRRPELETRVGLTWINRIGVVTLLLGAGFFFKYAVENDWIGPVARVLIGLAAAALAIAGGDVLYRRAQRLFAQGISGLGIALLYISFYAAYDFYHLIPDVLAFALLVLTTGAGAALALHYDAVPIAALGLFGGYLTPLLVRPALWVLDSYVALLDAAALALSRYKEWKLLEVLALFATAVLYATGASRSEVFLGTFFLAAYYVLFANARLPAVRFAAQAMAAVALGLLQTNRPSLYLLCSLALACAGLFIKPYVALAAYWFGYAIWASGSTTVPEGPAFVALTLAFLAFLAWSNWRPGEIAMMALNGPAYFAASYLLLDRTQHAWMGLLATGIAAVHIGTARRLLAEYPNLALLAAGLGAAFITVAIPVQFAGYAITIAWAMEAAALAWIGFRFRENRAAWLGAGILALILIRLAVFDRLLGEARLVVFTASAVAFWLSAKWIGRRAPALAIYIIGHAILLWGLSLEIERWALRTTAPENVPSVVTAGISIVFAVYAVMLIAAGVFTATTLNRLLGLALIAVVVLKLYCYDVWLLTRLYRTIAFVALGALLVLSSYVYSRFRERIENWWRERA